MSDAGVVEILHGSARRVLSKETRSRTAGGALSLLVGPERVLVALVDGGFCGDDALESVARAIATYALIAAGDVAAQVAAIEAAIASRPEHAEYLVVLGVLTSNELGDSLVATDLAGHVSAAMYQQYFVDTAVWSAFTRAEYLARRVVCSELDHDARQIARMLAGEWAGTLASLVATAQHLAGPITG